MRLPVAYLTDQQVGALAAASSRRDIGKSGARLQPPGLLGELRLEAQTVLRELLSRVSRISAVGETIWSTIAHCAARPDYLSTCTPSGPRLRRKTPHRSATQLTAVFAQQHGLSRIGRDMRVSYLGLGRIAIAETDVRLRNLNTETLSAALAASTVAACWDPTSRSSGYSLKAQPAM